MCTARGGPRPILKRINPIYLLIAFNVLFFVARDYVLPAGTAERFGDQMGLVLTDLGLFGYAGLLAIFTACSFFFIPLLIPINILCGAIYGPYVGTAIALAGITLGCIASTISVRHVFRGMQRAVDGRPSAKRILAQVERHGAIVVIAVRLAFVVPYLVQNIVLASSPIKLHRLTVLTAIGALPGAAIYSFLGAGLMQAENARDLTLYLAVPLVLLVVIALALKLFNNRFDSA